MSNQSPGSILSGQTQFVTLDASFVIGLCAKEPGKYFKAQMELGSRVIAGHSLHAPHLIIMESVYVLCGKLQSNTLTPVEHQAAVVNLQTTLAKVNFSGQSDLALISRAEQMRQGYGCSRSADSFYIALAEQLATMGSSELLTFDAGQQRQAAAVAPTVTVTLLTP